LKVLNGKKINIFPFCPGDAKEASSFLKNKSGIYLWTNIIDGKIYIGSAICLWRRFLSYVSSFERGGKNNVRLLRSVSKHGSKNFKFAIILICQNDKTRLKEEEQKFLDEISPYRKVGYNISKSAWRPLHCKISKKGRRSISERNTGERSEMSKLKNEDILYIKRELIKGEMLKTLAVKFGVSTTVISNIRMGKTWKHIRIDDDSERILKETHKKNSETMPMELVKKIKADFLAGLRAIDISKKYSLVYSTVHSIKNGHIYSYIK